MKYVTITLENDVTQLVRVWAAKKNTRISKLLDNNLKIKMTQEQGYDLAMQQ